MRARLLDMGEVSAVRSQSIYHAVARVAGSADSPVAILLRPASAAVSIGSNRDPALEVDLEFCLEQRIPVLRRLLPGPARMIQPSQLLIAVVVPGRRVTALAEAGLRAIVRACGALGVDTEFAEGGDLTVVGSSASKPRRMGSAEVGAIDESACLVAALTIDPDEATVPTHGRDRDLPSSQSEPGSLTSELGNQPETAQIAEALVEALEVNLDVEFIPSMPTPDEMDAIYEWDERLVFDLEVATGAASHLADQLVT